MSQSISLYKQLAKHNLFSKTINFDLKRIKLLVDNKLNLHKKTKVSYRSKNIKCGKESCQTCPHGPYWYAEWTESGKRRTKYLGKTLNES